MGPLVFLLEEASMAATLRVLLPLHFPGWREHVDWMLFSHEGKSDLEQSIPRKLRAWRTPGVKFVILRDNDSGDCHARKARLRELAKDRSQDTLIRLVCQELESWFLGDFAALAQAYPNAGLKTAARIPSKFRNPDEVRAPSEVLSRLINDPSKVTRAKRIAPYMDPARNRSTSFQVFLSGVERLRNG